MALAPLVYVLWNRHLQFDPNDPIWPNRDRFVLSAGRASAPPKELQSKFGFNPDAVVAAAQQQMTKSGRAAA